MVSEPPRPRNVTSRSVDTPCAPPTTGMRPASSAATEPVGPDLEDLGVGVGGVGDEAGLAAGEAVGRHAEVVQRHAQQRGGLALAGGDEHVHLAAGPDLGHLAGQAEQLVGLLAHRADDDDDVVAAALGARRRGRRPRGCARGRRPRCRRTSGRRAPRRATLPPRLGGYEPVGSLPVDERAPRRRAARAWWPRRCAAASRWPAGRRGGSRGRGRCSRRARG